MATIALATGSVGGKGIAALYGKQTKQLYKLVNLVDIATVKGSAFAQTDVITTVRLPAFTTLIAPRVRCLEAADVATLNIDVGVTSVLTSSTNNIIDEGNLCTIGQLVNAAATALVTLVDISTMADVSVTIMTFSGTVPTLGVFAVSGIVLDMNSFEGANIAAMNS